MCVEILCKLDFESYRDFVRFSYFKGKGYQVMPPLFFALVPVVGLVATFMGITFYDTMCVMLGILLMFMTLLFAFLYFIMPKITYRKLAPLFAGRITYRFYEDRLESEATGENVSGSDTLQYSALKKIFETKSAFYLVMVNNMSLILAKKYMDPRQVVALHDLFATRERIKFKCCYKPVQ